MKLYIITMFIFLYATTGQMAQAQNTEPRNPKGYIGVSGGLSMIMGNITKTDYADTTAGFASAMDTHFALDGAYFFNKNWGIGGLFSMSQYVLKNAQKLSDGYNDDFAVDSTTVTFTSYKTWSVMVGPYYTIPIKKLSIDFRVLVGAYSATTPKITVDLEDEPSHSFTQSASTATTFGLDGGIGARYEIIKNFGLAARIDYFYAKPDITINNVNRVVNVGRRIDKYHQPFTGVNATLGLIYTIR